MELTIINKKKEVVYKAKYRSDVEDAAAMIDECNTQEHPYYQTKAREVKVPGVSINEHSIRVLNDIHLQAPNPEALPALFFVKQGQVKTKFHYHDEQINFTRGEHSFLFNAFSSEDSYLKKQDQLSMFIVSFSRDYFMQLAEAAGAIMEPIANSIALNRPMVYRHNSSLSITPRMYEVMNEMSGCTFDDGLKNIFLQAKALELLTLHCAHASAVSGRKQEVIKLSAEDVSKVHLAHEILLSDLSNPPNLRKLAQLSGLNEFKLKRGFRVVFSNSVFGYLNDFRLDICRKQVVESRKPLSEIAYECGFGSLAHFSNAFKKKYGVSPLRLRA